MYVLWAEKKYQAVFGGGSDWDHKEYSGEIQIERITKWYTKILKFLRQKKWCSKPNCRVWYGVRKSILFKLQSLQNLGKN